MIRKGREIKETNSQIERKKKLENLKDKLQELIQSQTSWSMGQFRDVWNKKNVEKITEMVKLQDTIICRFNKESVSIVTNNIYL